ncbi:MAG: hypothetical protein JWM47_811 [Acidimicrobiales bacterium]|nr:hypothetical protein [Acidimicrobiales bacterium]
MACTNDGPRQVAGGQIEPATTPAPSTSTPPKATTTTTTAAALTPEDRIAAAYRDSQAVYADALLDPGHPEPRLSDTRTDPSLTNIRKILQEQAANGIVSRYPTGKPPKVMVRSVEIAGRNAVIHACELDGTLQVKVRDGTITDDDLVSELYRAEMQFTGGRWKVRYETLLATWNDGEGCDR